MCSDLSLKQTTPSFPKNAYIHCFPFLTLKLWVCCSPPSACIISEILSPSFLWQSPVGLLRPFTTLGLPLLACSLPPDVLCLDFPVHTVSPCLPNPLWPLSQALQSQWPWGCRSSSVLTLHPLSRNLSPYRFGYVCLLRAPPTRSQQLPDGAPDPQPACQPSAGPFTWMSQCTTCSACPHRARHLRSLASLVCSSQSPFQFLLLGFWKLLPCLPKTPHNAQHSEAFS